MAYPPLLDAVGALAINAVGLILVPAALRSGADSGSVGRVYTTQCQRRHAEPDCWLYAAACRLNEPTTRL